ncbi:hypothetical protein NHP190003_09670 [Helicobacter sp. NHP19-003]|uniref:Uncharacterized protein n=2 Tax=Helicobacter gastrocanis TaxID=2849641 RepID=A0ABN6I277_9HELI|nr:hypothetical protein NHP190003_09670 [Helicobacter sp. NHP19-003]
MILRYNGQPIIAKNPDFKPAVFLTKNAHRNDILRILFFFGRVLDEENIQELLQANKDQIPTYTPTKTTTNPTEDEDKTTISINQESAREIHAHKGVFMDPAKTHMGFYDLKAYLIIHKAGCLSWIAEYALKNFGWVCLNEVHQAQSAHIAWGDITDDQIYRGKEAHYFFAGICTERQRAQNPISFKDKAEVISFLVELFKPYALQDPNHVYHLSEAHDILQSVEIANERFGRRLYLEIVKIWGAEFIATLDEILQEGLFGTELP